MANDLSSDVQKSAEQFANAPPSEALRGKLDFSETSLQVVEQLLSEAAAETSNWPDKQLSSVVEAVGCYILEVARRQFGGKYYWFEQRQQPVLVVGEPNFKVAIITWDKVRGRLGGDEGNNIPFFYQGYAERVRRATPGDNALYV